MKNKLLNAATAISYLMAAVFIVGLIALAVMGESEAIIAICITLGIVAVVAVWSIHHVKRRQQPAIDLVKQQEPVVYFCAFPLGQELFVVSSNNADDSFKVWGIQKKRPVLLAKEKLSALKIQKSDIQLALFKKVQGIAVQVADKPGQVTNLALYGDSVKAIMPTLKDQDLDGAILRLERGTNQT